MRGGLKASKGTFWPRIRNECSVYIYIYYICMWMSVYARTHSETYHVLNLESGFRSICRCLLAFFTIRLPTWSDQKVEGAWSHYVRTQRERSNMCNLEIARLCHTKGLCNLSRQEFLWRHGLWVLIQHFGHVSGSLAMLSHVNWCIYTCTYSV